MSKTSNTVGAAKNKQLKPSEPTSTLEIKDLMELKRENILILRWEELVQGNDTLLIGANAIGLFDLQKLRERKWCDIKGQLESCLPKDTYDYLKYKRRVVQKKSERHLREENECSSAELDESDISVDTRVRDCYLKEKYQLFAEISDYKEKMYLEGNTDPSQFCCQLNYQNPHLYLNQ